MSKLLDDQQEFFYRLCLWGVKINEMGYDATWGDAYRDPRATFPYSSDGSLHPHRLAVDVNLFKNGKYIIDVEGWRECGELWEKMGGTWGGRFKKPDPNHLSWGEK